MSAHTPKRSPALNKRAWLLIALGATAMVHAETLPQRSPLDARIRTALYQPNQVYRLNGHVGYHLDIEFESDERFKGLSAGDPEALIYSAHDNILTLRPKVSQTDTNLTVTTNKRRYYFDYSASEHGGELSEQRMYAVQFVYPDAPSTVGKHEPSYEERIEEALALSAQTRPKNIDYWFCGKTSLKPIAASDDGVHTRIRFASRAELPTIFVRNDDGTESLLNFSMDAGDIVIHRVARKFILRRGRTTGCVVNKAFRGSGERLESGTVAPTVERVRREPK